MKCQICTQTTDVVFTVSNGRSLINVCRGCKKLSPFQMYEVLQERCRGLLEEARLGFAESYRSGDADGMKDFKETIGFVEKTMREMWKPPGAPIASEEDVPQ
jgi:hypothetical protein